MAFTNEQLHAINDCGQNIIVSAGAGSGKTAVLTERIYQKVLKSKDVSRLLVLTFTRPAALEMKTRIKNRILKDPDLVYLADQVDSSYITTFDAFALNMVKKYHYILNLNKNIAIIDSSAVDLKKKEILDKIILKKYENADPQFLDVLTKFTKKNDNVFVGFINSISIGIEKIIHKEKYLDNYIATHYEHDYIEKKINRFIRILEQKALELVPIIDELCDMFCNAKIAESLSTLSLFLRQKHDYGEYKSFFETFKFKQLRERDEDFSQAKKMLDNFKKKELTSFKELLSFSSIDEIRTSLYQTKPYVEIIIAILKEYFNELDEYKASLGLYEFNDIAMKSLELVENYPEIRTEIMNSFDEILIDEYQDTSDIQEAFISLISNNNVYMVGDIKQSIYRFRNANPYIFKQKYDCYEKGIGGQKIDLTYNFRSRPEVLNNINDFFSELMSLDYGDADYRESHQMVWGNTFNYKKDNKYNQEILVYKPDEKKIYSNVEIEAFTIAKKIKELINSKEKVFDKEKNEYRPITYHDIAIIMDRNTDYELYNRIFNYFAIPVDTIADKKLSNDSLLHLFNAIFNLIELAYSGGQMLPYFYISVARSFLFNESDNQILKDSFASFENTKIRNIARELNDYSKNNSLADTFEMILVKFNIYDNLVLSSAISDKLGVVEFVSNTVNSLALMGYSFSDLAKHFNDIIEKEIDVKNTNKASGNGVILINIHKSKGLEYPVCFFSGLYKAFNLSDMKDSFLYDKDFGFVTPYFTDRKVETIDKILLREAYLTSEISERIRLLYVAMTRAREKMYFLLPLESEKTINSVSECRSFKAFFLYNSNYIKKYMQQIDYLNYMTKDYLDQKDNALSFKEGTKYSYDTIEYDNSLVEKGKISKELLAPLTEKTRNLLDLGTKLHAILENIDLKKPSIMDLNLSVFERDLLEKVLALPCFNNLEQAKIYQEHEFYYELDGKKYHGIIDLLVMYKDHFEIIDYKLYNTDKKEYTRQLNVYYNYVRTFSDKPIKMLLLSLIKAETVVVERI